LTTHRTAQPKPVNESSHQDDVVQYGKRGTRQERSALDSRARTHGADAMKLILQRGCAYRELVNGAGAVVAVEAAERVSRAITGGHKAKDHPQMLRGAVEALLEVARILSQEAKAKRG
jgi:hypothetical protein